MSILGLSQWLPELTGGSVNKSFPVANSIKNIMRATR